MESQKGEIWMRMRQEIKQRKKELCEKIITNMKTQEGEIWTKMRKEIQEQRKGKYVETFSQI